MSDTKSAESEQETRTKLREKFIHEVNNVIGKQCTFHLHGGSTLQGTFEGVDIEFNNILIDNISNPEVKITNAILRASDVLYLDFRI